MTASDKKKVGLVAVLLTIAAILSYYRLGFGTAEAPVTAPKIEKKAQGAKAGQDAAIRLDLIENTADNNVGQKNLFQYGQKPAPPKPPETVSARPPTFIPSTQQNLTPSPPPPPPFRAFRYEGFSSKAGKIKASLSEGGNSYVVNEGDCLLGQYCITRITESLVEIEDVQQKSRRTFTRVQ